MVVASLTFVILIVVLAVGVNFLPLPDPTEQSVLFRLKPPSQEHVLGTDRLGRDILSRILWGARLSLIVGVGVVALSATLGTVLGVIAGYFRGWPSELVLRLTKPGQGKFGKDARSGYGFGRGRGVIPSGSGY